jgi:formylglycine-generating enzyme required for sulfatase activity
MVDVFISYPQKERELMLPLKRRLEALGLILFVDVDGRLDGSPTFPEALDKGVRAAKAVLGCWSPWALTRPWVQTECAMAKDENKLVAVERLALSPADVPALFYLVDRKPLTDFLEDQPHDGWAMTLSALGTKLRLWADRHPADAVNARAKAHLLDKAAAAERAALDQSVASNSPTAAKSVGPSGQSAAAQAWATIEQSLEISHYRRFERVFETDPAAFLWVIEAEARAKALERWAALDKADPDAIAEAIRSGFFPALDALAKEAMQLGAMARQAAQEQREREAALEHQRQQAAAEAAQKAEKERRARPLRAANYAREVAVYEQNREVIQRIDEGESSPNITANNWASDARVKLTEELGIPYDSPLPQYRSIEQRSFSIELPGVSGWPNPHMIAIPPGRFVMGAPPGEERSGDAEWPQHEVRIDYAFALGQHTVTFAEWDAALAAGARLEKPSDHGWGRGNRPVINVNWEDAQAFLAWLNEKAGLEGRPDAYRLPSEAEWEYACRAGTTTPFSFGATVSTAQANYNGDYTYGAGKKGEYRQETMPVGSFPANPFGLHEMHGNVWEWCQDCWTANYNGAPSDGAAWTTGNCSQRVLRGGSWYNFPQYLRSADRGVNDPTNRHSGNGFRLARTLFTS